VPDPLYLSLWFPQFAEAEMMPRLACVLQQFPFSPAHPGVWSIAVHPVSWGEATILERRFKPELKPEDAVEVAADLLHADYAYVFEAWWDLWTPGESGPWTLAPCRVEFIAQGMEFEEGDYEHSGHIQLDFGLDTPFLFEGVELTGLVEQRVRANVQKLVEFTSAVEKNCGVSARVLWSESEENLAQKLMARLQKVQ
jgi:hypothetical protein